MQPVNNNPINSSSKINNSSSKDQEINITEQIYTWACNNQDFQKGKELGLQLRDCFSTIHQVFNFVMNKSKPFNEDTSTFNHIAIGRVLHLVLTDQERKELITSLKYLVLDPTNDLYWCINKRVGLLMGLLPPQELVSTMQRITQQHQFKFLPRDITPSQMNWVLILSIMANFDLAKTFLNSPLFDLENIHCVFRAIVPAMDLERVKYLYNEMRNKDEERDVLRAALMLALSDQQWSDFSQDPKINLSPFIKVRQTTYPLCYSQRFKDVLNSPNNRLDLIEIAASLRHVHAQDDQLAEELWHHSCKQYKTQSGWLKQIDEAACSNSTFIFSIPPWQVQGIVGAFDSKGLVDLLNNNCIKMQNREYNFNSFYCYLLATCACTLNCDDLMNLLSKFKLQSSMENCALGIACILNAYIIGDNSSNNLVKFSVNHLKDNQFKIFIESSIKSLRCTNITINYKPSKADDLQRKCQFFNSLYEQCSDAQWESILSVFGDLLESGGMNLLVQIVSVMVTSTRSSQGIEWFKANFRNPQVKASFLEVCEHALLLDQVKGEAFIKSVLQDAEISSDIVKQSLAAPSPSVAAALMKHLSKSNFPKVAQEFAALFRNRILPGSPAYVEQQIIRGQTRSQRFLALVEEMTYTQYTAVLKKLKLSNEEARSLYREIYNSMGLPHRWPTATTVNKLYFTWCIDTKPRERSSEAAYEMACLLKLHRGDKKEFKEFADKFLSRKIASDWRTYFFDRDWHSFGADNFRWQLGLLAADESFCQQNMEKLLAAGRNALPEERLSLIMPFLASKLSKDQLLQFTNNHGLDFWSRGLIYFLNRDQRGILDGIAAEQIKDPTKLRSVETYITARFQYVKDLSGNPSLALQSLRTELMNRKMQRPAEKVTILEEESILDDELPLCLRNRDVRDMSYMLGSQGKCRCEVLQRTLDRFSLNDTVLDQHGLTPMTAYYVLFHTVVDTVQPIEPAEENIYTTYLHEQVQALMDRENLTDQANVLDYIKRVFNQT